MGKRIAMVLRFIQDLDEKFKQHAKTQDDILYKLYYVKDDKVECCISTRILFMEGRRGGSKALTLHVSSQTLAMLHAAL